LDLRDRKSQEAGEMLNEELRALYGSPHIIRVIKSRRMKWAGHVARMEGLSRKCIQYFGWKT
jgi:hypothetical protein